VVAVALFFVFLAYALLVVGTVGGATIQESGGSEGSEIELGHCESRAGMDLYRRRYCTP